MSSTEHAILEGAFVSLKTMADGSPRITIDLSCGLSEVAMMGFQPGTPLAIAVMTQAAAQASMQKKAAEPEQKGGELAKWAGIFSSDGSFVHWAVQADRELWDECFRVTEPIGDYGAVAAEFIRQKCGVESRRELDHNKEAGQIFRDEIMRPFHQWKEKR